MKKLKILENLFYVGVQDKDLKVFDIVMVSNYGTSYNSYIFKDSEECYVLFETVKISFFDEYIQKIKEIIGSNDLNNIKYVIVNHTEPDHSGSLLKLLELIPNICFVASTVAIKYLKEILNVDFNYLETEKIKKLELKTEIIEFIDAPFLHWPDSIYSYLKNNKCLVTCDSFGAHFSFDEVISSKFDEETEKKYWQAYFYYWKCIFSPFKNFLLSAINKIKNLEFNYILNGHGPLLDNKKHIDLAIKKYVDWSITKKNTEIKKYLIFYCSAYGYTNEILEEICKGISSVNSKVEFKIYKIDILDYQTKKFQILLDLETSDAVLVGSPTINSDALPIIWDILGNFGVFSCLRKFATCFGSYGWSGEAIPNIEQRLTQLKFKVFSGLKILFKPSDKQKNIAFNFGKNFATCVENKKILFFEDITTNEDKYLEFCEKNNPESLMLNWKCKGCGEIIFAKKPPLNCPVCEASHNHFFVINEEKNIIEDKKFKIAIIGGGAAGVKVCEEIRKINKKSDIFLFLDEKKLPYYRPIVSDILSNPEKINSKFFYIKPENWYHENNINLVFEKINELDLKNMSINFLDREHIFDYIILSTGAKPIYLPNIGLKHDISNLFSCNTYADSLKIFDFIKENKIKTATVIGGGLLGLENANALDELGLKINIIELKNQLLPIQTDLIGSEILKQNILKKNHKIFLGKNIENVIIKDNEIKKLVLTNNEEIESDIYIISIGVAANIELFKDQKIKYNRGIITNEFLETSINNVYACGDVVEIKDKFIPKIWATALDQAKIVANNIFFPKKSYVFQNFPFILDVFNTKIVSFNYDKRSENLKSISLNDVSSYGKLYFDKQNNLIAGISINNKNFETLIYSHKSAWKNLFK
ncbi:FAD-dependent oxidoreductase [symbiont of Argiope bruennichi]|uniref:FAD-dependent oxidoreductase n=1 Tax=symbiont of Argiope bruennichi TaxID=2810479 RepID=UPI003DA697A7